MMKTIAPEETKTQQKENIASALQIKTILVPLDFSRASMHALKYSIGLAEEFKAAIHLVHVQPTDEFTSIHGAGRLMLDCADAIALMQDRLGEIQEKHDVKFWPDNCHVLSGKPYQEIVKLARELDIDLIVLPTRGHSGLKHVVLGSTAERVVRFASCPVLIPRGAKFNAMTWSPDPSEKFSPRTILVPVDFSECSLAGVKYAAALAKKFNSTLHLVHVTYPYVESIGFHRVPGELGPLIKEARDNAQLEMDALKQSKWLAQIACETKITMGHAVDEICAQSSRDNVDLIVTATHGRTGIKHALIGSVAEHVIRYAECPVISVPSRFNPDN